MHVALHHGQADRDLLGLGCESDAFQELLVRGQDCGHGVVFQREGPQLPRQDVYDVEHKAGVHGGDCLVVSDVFLEGLGRRRDQVLGIELPRLGQALAGGGGGKVLVHYLPRDAA